MQNPPNTSADVLAPRTYTQLGTLQQAHMGGIKCCGRGMLSLTTVDRQNRPGPQVSVSHQPGVAAGQDFREPPATPQHTGFCYFCFSSLKQSHLKVQHEICVLTSCKDLIEDFVLIILASMTFSFFSFYMVLKTGKLMKTCYQVE